MITEKEHKVSNENYEISKKIYYLFKKYKNYDKKLQEEPYRNKYNPDNIFRSKQKKLEVVPVEEQIELVEYKKQKWYQKIFNIIKGIFKRK